MTIHRAELLGSDGERATYEIECSSGTYVRTLIESLGDAYCEQLRRVAIGSLRVEDAGTELEPAQALSFLPERALSDDEARRVGHGQRLAAAAEPDGALRMTHADRLLAVGVRDGDAIRPQVVLAQESPTE